MKPLMRFCVLKLPRDWFQVINMIPMDVALGRESDHQLLKPTKADSSIPPPLGASLFSYIRMTPKSLHCPTSTQQLIALGLPSEAQIEPPCLGAALVLPASKVPVFPSGTEASTALCIVLRT